MPFPLHQIESRPVSHPLIPMKIDNFDGGLVTSMPEHGLAANQFSMIENFYPTETRTLKARGPYRPWMKDSANTVTDTATKPCLFWHDKKAAFATVQYGTGGTTKNQIEYWNSGWTPTTVTGDDYVGTPEIVKYSVGNATDYLVFDPTPTTGVAPRRMDSSGTVTAMGLTAPSAPTLALDAATITLPERAINENGTFSYKTTYVYNGGSTNTLYGESAPTAAASVAVSGANSSTGKTVTVTFASSLPSNVAKVNIYRSPAGRAEGPYRLVGWATSGTTFKDNCPIGEEGIELPVDPCTLVHIKRPFVADGRVWGFDRDYPSKLVFSEKGAPDRFPALNYYYLNAAGTGIGLFNKNLYVFTEKACYVLPNADPEASPDLLKVSDKGCVSHRSIVDVNEGLCWVAADNVYFANFNTQSEDGDFAVPVGRPIEDQIQGIPVARREYIVAAFWQNRYYLSFTDKMQPTATYNNKTLVWDVRTGTRQLSQGGYGGWAQMSWKADAFEQTSGYIYFLDIERRYIFEHGYDGGATPKDYASYTDAGTTVSGIIKTGLIYLSHPESRKKPHAVVIMAESSGTELVIDFEMNLNDFKTTTIVDLGTSQVETLTADELVWDRGHWATVGTTPSISSVTQDTDFIHMIVEFSSIHGKTAAGTMYFTGITGAAGDADAVAALNGVAGVTYIPCHPAKVRIAEPHYSATLNFSGATAYFDYTGAEWCANASKGYYISKRVAPNTKGNVTRLALTSNAIADTEISNITVYMREIPYTI